MNKPRIPLEDKARLELEVRLEAVRVLQVSKASLISSRELKVQVPVPLETFSMNLKRCLVGRKVEEELKLRPKDKTLL